jgi:hypothetical protein
VDSVFPPAVETLFVIPPLVFSSVSSALIVRVSLMDQAIECSPRAVSWIYRVLLGTTNIFVFCNLYVLLAFSDAFWNRLRSPRNLSFTYHVLLRTSNMFVFCNLYVLWVSWMCSESVYVLPA